MLKKKSSIYFKFKDIIKEFLNLSVLDDNLCEHLNDYMEYFNLKEIQLPNYFKIANDFNEKIKEENKKIEKINKQKVELIKELSNRTNNLFVNKDDEIEIKYIKNITEKLYELSLKVDRYKKGITDLNNKLDRKNKSSEQMHISICFLEDKIKRYNYDSNAIKNNYFLILNNYDLLCGSLSNKLLYDDSKISYIINSIICELYLTSNINKDNIEKLNLIYSFNDIFMSVIGVNDKNYDYCVNYINNLINIVTFGDVNAEVFERLEYGFNILKKYIDDKCILTKVDNFLENKIFVKKV